MSTTVEAQLDERRPMAAGPMSTDGTAEDRLCESRQVVFQVQLGLHDLPFLPLDQI